MMTAIGRDDVMLWVVQQAGVAIETLRQRYTAWLPTTDRNVWTHLDPKLTATKPKRLTVVA